MKSQEEIQKAHDILILAREHLNAKQARFCSVMVDSLCWCLGCSKPHGLPVPAFANNVALAERAVGLQLQHEKTTKGI